MFRRKLNGNYYSISGFWWNTSTTPIPLVVEAVKPVKAKAPAKPRAPAKAPAKAKAPAATKAKAPAKPRAPKAKPTVV